jgi:hypothetical protein
MTTQTCTAALDLPAPPERRPLTLWAVFAANRGRLLLTYALFSLENFLRLAQPLVLGWAITDLLHSSLVGLAVFGGQHVLHLLLGVARRMYDTRAFTAIYTDLAARLVLEQRGRAVEVSCVAARSALSREIVDFFEREVAVVLAVLYSVGGALVMLGLTDWVLVPCCLALLLPVCVLGRTNARRSYRLNGRLNDQLEREVEVIHRARPAEVRGHYCLVARWRVMLSDWEAVNFGLMELLVFGLMAAALARCCAAPGVDAGHIFTVFGYVLLYVLGVLNVPVLIQQLSRLRDISRRMRAEE